ncbi:hypothetical protein SRRS_33320 [Sporomusa rhizae]|uniref:hypothetical protein n=1 Tax=Sporomusa rhizae TaxID=357999 RepID=UPI00352B86AC
MGCKKVDFDNCVGSVNILLDDRVVLQGQIIRDNNDDHDRKTEVIHPKIDVFVENDNEFITLELTCDAMIIRDNAELEIINPTLYEEGNRVRINVSQIAAIGPSNGCPEDTEEEEETCVK